MKELSIEEKAQRYDKALERAKNTIEVNQTIPDIVECVKSLFPELKESEDERIRKELIKFVKVNIPDEERYITWLEKQGEHKPTDNVEPKFEIGDWIVDGIGTVYQIKEIKEDVYLLQFYNSSDIISSKISTIDNDCHLWTIQDAKAGDVLVMQKTNVTYESIFIFNKIENDCIIQYLHYFTTDAGEEICEARSIDGFVGFVETNVRPATKEQRDTLMKAMADARWEFDFEKKELKKIIDEKQIKKNLQDNSFSRMFKQSLAWSEEDIKMFVNIKACLRNAKRDYSTELDWLKSLRPQKQWKPSEYQTRCLQDAINDYHSRGYTAEVLGTLLEQLKQL